VIDLAGDKSDAGAERAHRFREAKNRQGRVIIHGIRRRCRRHLDLVIYGPFGNAVVMILARAGRNLICDVGSKARTNQADHVRRACEGDERWEWSSTVAYERRRFPSISSMCSSGIRASVRSNARKIALMPLSRAMNKLSARAHRRCGLTFRPFSSTCTARSIWAI